MKKSLTMKNPAIWFACVAIALSACATEPAYWLKEYPSASKAKADACLKVADAAYDKANNGQDNGFAVLAKGRAWEACMDAK